MFLFLEIIKWTTLNFKFMQSKSAWMIIQVNMCDTCLYDLEDTELIFMYANLKLRSVQEGV